MKTKSLCALALGIVVLLSGCSGSDTLSGADKAKEEQIAALKASVCEIIKVTGKDTVNCQDKIDVWNNGVVPSYPPLPSEESFHEKALKFDKDIDKLIALRGPWIDPIEGTGWIKFCNS